MNGRPSHNGSGVTRRRYECNAYHIKGSSVCHANGIDEAPLMDLVVRKLQEHVLSEVAIEKLLTSTASGWRPGGRPFPSMTAGSASRLRTSTGRSTKGPSGCSRHRPGSSPPSTRSWTGSGRSGTACKPS